MADNPTDTILEAIAHALHGDHDRALRMLQPLVDESPSSAYAMLSTLARIAARPAREFHGPDHMFAVEVEGPDGPASADDLPPALRFAARFVTAKANGDDETAMALFYAVAEHSDTNQTHDLAEAIGVVFDMATVAAGQSILARRTAAAEGQA